MIKILDSTLREGEQSPRVYFSPAAKLRIATLLDQVGVDVIEAGNPAVDPEIAEALLPIARAGLHARIGAHARCRIEDVEKAIACDPGFLGVFLCVSEARLRSDYRLTRSGALERIRTVISYARAAKREMLIRFTIEDATRTPLCSVVEAAAAAANAGADIISLADTTGFATPFARERSLGQMLRRVKEELARQNLEPAFEVHCHNDRGLALANAIEAYHAGATIIDTTVLGLGERAGIVDLAELLVNMREISGEGAKWDFRSLGILYQFVSEEAGIPIPTNHPVMGEHAFTHTAGVHVNALARDPVSYQSLRPEPFGRLPQFALGVQSGCGSVKVALKAIARDDLIADRPLVSRILAEVKAKAVRGESINLERDFPALVNRVAEPSA